MDSLRNKARERASPLSPAFDPCKARFTAARFTAARFTADGFAADDVVLPSFGKPPARAGDRQESINLKTAVEPLPVLDLPESFDKHLQLLEISPIRSIAEQSLV
jgi:hypothetical protein